MSNNILKGSFIQLSEENTRVIDTNDLVKKRIEESESRLLREKSADEEPEKPREQLTDEEGNPVFDEDGNAVYKEFDVDEGSISELTRDADAPEEKADAPITLNVDEVRVECEEMIKEAEEKAEKIRKDAEEYAKTCAEKATEDGYEAGRAEAYAELEEERKKLDEERVLLQKEYEDRIKEAEPAMVDAITDIYKRVFGENFFSKKDVMVALINRALIGVDTDETVSIYVSPDDLDMLTGFKDDMLRKVSLEKEPELKQKEDLASGMAKIETPYGIIDCGIDTELTELTRTLKMLSHEG